jgi:hypothetical protein
MRIQAKLVSTATKHGASPIKDSEQTALAIKKGKAILGKRRKGDQPDSQDGSKDHSYGAHGGSVHVHTLLEQEGSADELDKALESLIPKINTFRNMASIDLRAKKKAYGDGLEELTREYDKKYGASLTPAISIEFTNKCAAMAFRYYRHQIVIRFIGTIDEFDDKDRLAPYGKPEDKLFISEVKVKSVFTMSLFSPVQLLAIVNGSDKVVKATSRDIPFSLELRESTYGPRFKKIPVEGLDTEDSDD